MDSSDLASLCKSLMLTRCVLANRVRGGCSNWRETLRIVRARIRRWQAGDFIWLWSEVLHEDDRLTQRRRKTKKSTAVFMCKANTCHISCAVEDGQYKIAIQALSSNRLDQPSTNVFTELLGKHHQVNTPIPPGPTPPPVQVADIDVNLMSTRL